MDAWERDNDRNRDFENAGKNVTAHCTLEIAEWFDPTGTLRKSGLLVVDLPSPKE
jgi:hypothetical protein